MSLLIGYGWHKTTYIRWITHFHFNTGIYRSHTSLFTLLNHFKTQGERNSQMPMNSIYIELYFFLMRSYSNLSNRILSSSGLLNYTNICNQFKFFKIVFHSVWRFHAVIDLTHSLIYRHIQQMRPIFFTRIAGRLKDSLNFPSTIGI